jgi:hypothetical protein
MIDYAAFGGCLRSDTELTLLRPLEGVAPDWTLRTAAPSPPPGGTLLGRGVAQASIGVRLYRRDRGFRLEYDDTGTFDISEDGSEIVWYRPADARADVAAIDICGRVLATALYGSGTLCLHGSGVAFADVAIGMLAPSYHGKSTLAQALVAAGTRLVSDDVLPVEQGRPARVRPGIHQVRLWADSAERFAASYIDTGIEQGRKYYIDTLPAESLLTVPAPLSAIYLLVPVEAAAQAAAVERAPVGPVDAVISILKNVTLGSLLGGAEAARLFQLAHEVATNVPIYELRYVRAFDRLPEVVEQIMAWHAEPALARPGA